MAISQYQHRCVIRSGSLEGNTHVQDVDSIDVEYKNTCDNCGGILATSEQITAHIYAELLNPA